MKIAVLIQSINTQLAGELLSISELKDFVDKAIDDINTRLNAKFPVLTDVILSGNDEYTAIPDKYIRTVVIPGAAFKYYTTDEEGAAVAPKYEEEYLRGLFYMERDYIMQIPDEYADNPDQGYLIDPNFRQPNIPWEGFPTPKPTRKEGEFTIDGSFFQL